MNKSKSQKTGGRKAAQPLTLADLRTERNRLEFYRVPDVDSLRKIVFANWLQQHTFTEKFAPLEFIGH